LLGAAATALTLLAAPPALAAQTRSSLSVTAIVAPSCSVSTIPASGAVARCSSGAALTISDDRAAEGQDQPSSVRVVTLTY
jgi:hypothetical protein